MLAALPLTAGAVSLQSFTTIYYPNSTFTLVKGVNDYGELVGEYWVDDNGKNVTHAFYYDGSTYYNVDRVNSSVNEAWGINNAGMIVAGGTLNGIYTGYYGFLNDFSNYTDSPPNELFDVNDNNFMVGSNRRNGTSQPFLFDLDQGIYTDISVPWGNRSAAVGINNLNQVVGSFWNSSGVFTPHGYLFDGTDYTRIDFPGAVSTSTYGINDAGLVVGEYNDTSGKRHGFLYDIYTGVFTSLDIPLPGSRGTHIYEISNNNLLVGGYFDELGIHRGFIASLVPVPPALLLFGSGLAGLFGMTRLRSGQERETQICTTPHSFTTGRTRPETIIS
jgi:hypothetical protein